MLYKHPKYWYMSLGELSLLLRGKSTEKRKEFLKEMWLGLDELDNSIFHLPSEHLCDDWQHEKQHED